MLLPSTFAVTLALLILSVLCWGSWAATLKKSAWRFELYYIDFCMGALLAAIIASFTVGSMGTDISVQDSFLLVAKRPILIAVASGAIFNLGNMLIVGSIEVGGMATAMPIGLAFSLIVSSIWNYVANQGSRPAMVFGGAALLLISVVFAAVAHSKLQAARRKSAAEARAALDANDPAAAARKKRSQEGLGPGGVLGTLLALAGGLLVGISFPITGMAMEGEWGFTNPFAVALLFSIGMLLSTFVYNLYFINLPVKGLPVSFFAYFTGTMGQHALALIGGIVWMVGTCSYMTAAAAQGDAKAGVAFSQAVLHGAAFLSVLLGLSMWKEMEEAPGGAGRTALIAGVVLLAGVGLVAYGSMS